MLLVTGLLCVQKKKADGPTDPQQPAKKQKLPAAEPMATPTGDTPTGADSLKVAIESQGSIVRELKTSGADKVRHACTCGGVACHVTSLQGTIDIEVKKLIALKARYSDITGRNSLMICHAHICHVTRCWGKEQVQV